MANKAIELHLEERRSFSPPPQLKKAAHVRSASIYTKARKSPTRFWAQAAKELDWFKPWKKVLERR